MYAFHALHIGGFVIITTLYILIVYKLRRHRAPGNQTDLARRRREQQRRKVLKMSVVIITSLYLSWVLFVIIRFLKLEGKLNSLAISVFVNLDFTASFMAHMSFTYNFFIYLIFNDIYRDNFKAMISKCCCMLTGSGNRVRDVNVVGTVSQELEEPR